MGGNKLKHKQIDVPKQLQSIPDPPKQLFAIGDGLDGLLSKPCVAIVGSRKVTPYGKSVTEKLASELAGKGVVIVSGLAFGVDAIAHKTAIEAGGKGIIVLATGLDQISPISNVNLAHAVVEHGGVIVSECPAGTRIFRSSFLARNRIISGLSNAVLVTEAGLRSGSLSTANRAILQGKPVMAVPGNITSLNSEGTNNLIKAGAHPITSIDDVLSLLNINTSNQTVLPLAQNQEEYVVLKLIHEGITDGAELLVQSELDAILFNQTLTMLELTNKIKPLGNNHWTLV